MHRRRLLAGAAVWVAAKAARADILRGGGGVPWRPYAGAPPTIVSPAGWRFFTPEEAASVEALVDRLIPPDEFAGGKDAGCAVFIDRQLAGPYGTSASQYMRPPFHDGTKEQGIQSPVTPAARYRAALAALDRHCTTAFAGKRFWQLPADDQDRLIARLEKGGLTLEGTSGVAFFEMLLKDTRYGFFGDPVHGGNRDMVSWRMIGFPGTRYDYRDWIDRHNQRYDLPPVSIAGRPAWATRP